MRYRRITIKGASYFFTLVTHKRRRIFSNPEVVHLLADAIEGGLPRVDIDRLRRQRHLDLWR